MKIGGVMRRLMTAAALALLASCTRQSEIDEQSIEPDAEALSPGDEVEPMEEPAAPYYVGVWAVDPAICAIAPGSGDPAPIAITEGEFIGYENRCRIGAAEEGTEGGWRLSLVCLAEGVEYVETVDVDIDGDMLRLKREDAPETAFVRCGEEQD